MNPEWNKIYMRLGLNSLPNLNKWVLIKIENINQKEIYKAKLLKDELPVMSIDEQYYWEIENLGCFSLIEPDYWTEL